jgi:hypothetical protein
MPTLDLEKIKMYRAEAFNLPPSPAVATPKQALEFVNGRGFVFFWPIKSVSYPNLWTAVAGDRPVPNEHDDPGHVTWRWKDEALDKRIWYYAKVLRRKATIISLETAPYFYALTENYGSPDEDYLIAYQEGRLPQAAKQVYETILEKGPLNTIDLRRFARLSNAKDSEFNKALEVLQQDFKILPVGVAQAGAWRYAFVYGCTARHFQDLPAKARDISEVGARRKLLGLYFAGIGAATARDANRLFSWGQELTKRALSDQVRQGGLVACNHPSYPGEWYALPDLVV